jgi:hypothetical protein
MMSADGVRIMAFGCFDGCLIVNQKRPEQEDLITVYEVDEMVSSVRLYQETTGLHLVVGTALESVLIFK